MMRLADPQGNLHPESEESWKDFFAQPGRHHYVVLAMRPGAGNFCQDLERRYFTSGTLMNIFMSLRVFEWMNTLWFIVSVPDPFRDRVVAAATANGLRIVNGIPTMFTGGEMVPFPVAGPNVFTLENVSGHPVYER